MYLSNTFLSCHVKHVFACLFSVSPCTIITAGLRVEVLLDFRNNTTSLALQVPLVGSVSMLYYKHVRRLSMRLRDVESEAQSFALARLANMRTVRAFANETLEAERFHEVRKLTKSRR